MALFGLLPDKQQEQQPIYPRNNNPLPSIQQGRPPDQGTVEYLNEVKLPESVKKRLEESAWWIDLKTMGLSFIESEEEKEILIARIKNELDIRNANRLQVDMPPEYVKKIQAEEDHRGLIILTEVKAKSSINHIMLDKVTSATSTIETKQTGEQGLVEKTNNLFFK